MAGAKSAASEYLERSKKINAGNPNTAKINEAPSPFLGQVKKGIDWTTATVGGVVQKSKDLRNTARNDQGSYPKIQQRIGDYFGGTGDATLGDEKKKLDQTLRQNTFKPSTLAPNKPMQNSPGNGTTNTVPSKLIGAQQEAGTSRFDKSNLTLGNNPYTGQVGMFKDGQTQEPGSVRLSGGNLGGTPLQAGQSPFFMKSQAAQGLVPQPGTASAIPGMQQNPAVTMPGGDMTGLMNQETAMLSSILQGTKSGANFGQNFGQTPAAPGGAPQIGDRAYRDLEKNITDMRNQQKAFTSGNYSPSAFGTLSPGQRMNYAASLGEQIKGMEDTLFNRSSLANDLVKALVAAQSGENIAGTTAKAGTEQQKIKTAGDVQVGAMDAAATQGSNAYKQDINAEHKNKTRQSVNIRAGIKSLEDEYAQNQDPSIKKKLDDLRAQLLTLEADDASFFSAAPDAN